MAYVPAKHGKAEYGSWMQLPNAIATALPSIEGTDDIDFREQKFANLVYVVNPTDIGGGSGGGGITDLQIAQITNAISNQTTAITSDIDNAPIIEAIGDQTTTVDSAITTQTNALTPGLTELIIDNTYSRIIQTIGTDTYIAQAPRGSTQSASVWRVQKIDANGSRSWAGTGTFNQPANSVETLTYNY